MTVTYISNSEQVVSHTATRYQEMFDLLMFLGKIGIIPDPTDEDHQVFETEKGTYIFSWSEGHGSSRPMKGETPSEFLTRRIFDGVRAIDEGGEWYD